MPANRATNGSTTDRRTTEKNEEEVTHLRILQKSMSKSIIPSQFLF